MDLLTYYSDLAVAYPEYITQKQFCEVCGICHKTAYNLTRRGEISYEIVDTPTGRIHHIKLTDALAYLYKKDTLYGNDENVNRQIYEVLQAHFSYLPDLLRTQQIRELTGFSMTAIQRWVLEKRITAILGRKGWNSFVIMGVAGIGKSTVVKHIMLSEYMKGTKILCIDPESEYKDMCRNLNGSWLNAGGGKNGRSNLLQIRPAPRDDDDETDKLYTDEGNGMSDMALHMKTLEIEFSLYLPSLTDMQKAILKQTIIELYNQFGIFWETDIRQLKATDFPILSDLHALLEKKAEANKENPVYRDLAMLLYDAAAGSDSFLWNGHTTLEANSRFICLDTHDLQNASDNVKRTQYLNLLSWCWEEMSRDRNERCLLVCDEAYLMIDPQVPQSLVFLRNVEKRARKYEAGMAIISHSVVDFLAPEVKMYGQALLDIPCYKILMGCDGKNLQETKDLYNLTDAEQELLESKRRGHALFIIGSKRLHVNFEIPAYKFSYMGKAGGR